jgi:hypothetical protein
VSRGQLPGASGGTDEHQIGDVDDADEQNEEYGAPEQIERAPDPADQVFLEGGRDTLEPGVGQDLFELREALHVARVERVELLLGLRGGRSTAEPPDHRPVIAVPRVI